jgi:hypothetical protein
MVITTSTASRREDTGRAGTFLVAHPELYEMTRGGVRLAIHGGTIALGSLAAPGFASSAQPDWATLAPLRRTVATAV